MCSVLKLRESMSSFRARVWSVRWEIVRKSREKTRGQLFGVYQYVLRSWASIQEQW